MYTHTDHFLHITIVFPIPHPLYAPVPSILSASAHRVPQQVGEFMSNSQMKQLRSHEDRGCSGKTAQSEGSIWEHRQQALARFLEGWTLASALFGGLGKRVLKHPHCTHRRVVRDPGWGVRSGGERPLGKWSLDGRVVCRNIHWTKAFWGSWGLRKPGKG